MLHVHAVPVIGMTPGTIRQRMPIDRQSATKRWKTVASKTNCETT
jgi:hypothetical protein